MRKLKAGIIDKLIEAKATSAEIDFLLWLSHKQNEAGLVRGVYYREVARDLRIAYQTFYNVKNSLEKKKIIRVSKDVLFGNDWDIQIMGNDFSGQELRQGGASENYLNTGLGVFYSDEFYQMKANEKLMTMLYVKIAGAGRQNYHIGTDHFFAKYTRLFGVTKRTLQNYLYSIRSFFAVGVKNREYWINPLRRKVYAKSDHTTDRSERALQVASSLCRRFRLEEPQKAYNAIKDLLEQYYYTVKKDLEISLTEALRHYLRMTNGGIDSRGWKQREINPKLLHKIFREHIPEGAFA